MFYKFETGHTAVLSTVCSLPFCICVQVHGNSQWRGFEQWTGRRR